MSFLIHKGKKYQVQEIDYVVPDFLMGDDVLESEAVFNFSGDKGDAYPVQYVTLLQNGKKVYVARVYKKQMSFGFEKALSNPKYQITNFF